MGGTEPPLKTEPKKIAERAAAWDDRPLEVAGGCVEKAHVFFSRSPSMQGMTIDGGFADFWNMFNPQPCKNDSL